MNSTVSDGRSQLLFKEGRTLSAVLRNNLQIFRAYALESDPGRPTPALPRGSSGRDGPSMSGSPGPAVPSSRPSSAHVDGTRQGQEGVEYSPTFGQCLTNGLVEGTKAIRNSSGPSCIASYRTPLPRPRALSCRECATMRYLSCGSEIKLRPPLPPRGILTSEIYSLGPL